MSNITDWLVSETSCMVLLSELPPPFPHRLQWGRCLLDRQRWKSSFKGILYWRSNSQGCLKDGPSHVMWPEVYKNAYGETDSSTFPLKWADMTVACSGAHRLIGRSAFLKGLFVLIQADVGGVWSLDLCGWDLSVGTLHCNVKLFTCFNIWCSTSICVCLEFFFFSFFPVQYPSIWTISNHMKHWSRAQACNGFACWFMCDAAAFCTTCLQKSQTLDIVKCTGF